LVPVLLTAVHLLLALALELLSVLLSHLVLEVQHLIVLSSTRRLGLLLRCWLHGALKLVLQVYLTLVVLVHLVELHQQVVVLSAVTRLISELIIFSGVISGQISSLLL
jgi:hypothetical protein